MKQYMIIQAYNATEKLSECDLTEKEQWEIYKLRKFLRPHFEFQQEREEEIKKKYSSYVDSDGKVNSDKAQDVINDLNNISNLDVELDEYKKITIKMTKGITCKIIESLEDFIEFIPPDE